MPIYTKTGDKGKTSLFKGQRISKTDPHIEFLGSLDELNAAIGLALSSKSIPQVIKISLQTIQNQLLHLGAHIAGSDQKYDFQIATHDLENQIDHLTKELPTLKEFILPGGCQGGALAHLARALCRRAERNLVALNLTKPVPADILKYANRLSDYLFTAARYINEQNQTPEPRWKK